MTKRKTTWKPNWVTHPGEHLQELLEVKKMSQAKAARRIGITPKLLSTIVNCKARVSAATAIKLERLHSIYSAEMWLRFQNNYDLYIARKGLKP